MPGTNCRENPQYPNPYVCRLRETEMACMRCCMAVGLVGVVHGRVVYYVFLLLFKMLIPTPGSRRRGSAQTRASRRTRSGTVADSEEERSALPTAGTWPAIEAGHRDSLLYSGGKNPRDSAATQASAHHHTHHIEADGTHTSKQDTAAQHTRTASHTTPSSPKLPGGSPAPQSVVALHSMRSGSKEAGSAAGP